MLTNYQHPLFNLPNFMLDILPIEIWVIIYKFKHQLEFIDIQKEFLYYKKRNYMYIEPLLLNHNSTQILYTDVDLRQIPYHILYKKKNLGQRCSYQEIILCEKNGIEIMNDIVCLSSKDGLKILLEKNNLKIRKSYSKKKMIQQLMKC